MAKQERIQVVQVAEPVIEIDESEIKLPLGRPIDPESERQKRLREYDEKRSAGLLHRGRPANPESPSHIAKAEREAKRAGGVELKRGRPVDPESPRQVQVRKRNARLEVIKQQLIAKKKDELGLLNKMNKAITATSTK